MTSGIKITEEKIRVVKELIKHLEEDIVNPTMLTRQMLGGLIMHCKELINSDF